VAVAAAAEVRKLQLKNPLGEQSHDTAAISAKAKDFAIFSSPAVQQLLRQ
jgi:hypothetical protein